MTTTRIAATADWHRGARHFGPIALEDQERALTEFVAQVNAENVDLILVAGDTTENAHPAAREVESIGRTLSRLSAPVILIPGNHEGPAVAEIARHFRGEVQVATTPELLAWRDRIDVACLPWLPDQYVRATAQDLDRQEVARALTLGARQLLEGFAAQRRPGIPLVLLTHATVAGTETDTGYRMPNLPRSEYILPLDALAPFDLVVAGHIHKHQGVPPNVVVPGSLSPLDFAETEPKGWVLIEVRTAAGGPTLVTWTFRPVASRRIVPFTLDYDREQKRVIAGIHEGQGEENVQGALVRVQIRADEATAREYPPSRISRALYEAGAAFVKVELDVVRSDRRRDAEMTAALTPAMALERWVRTQGNLLESDEDRALFRDLADEALEVHKFGTGGSGHLGDIELLRVEAQDFLGVDRGALDLEPGGLYVLAGAVGMGKSTLGCDAARFALFGTTRAGSRTSDGLIRRGAPAARVSVELQTGETRLRVVRKLARSTGGRVSQTLDVLEAVGASFGMTTAGEGSAWHETHWRPLSTGKIADGEATIANLLGGLTDETVTAANFIVQREADAFTRARPEDRKRILAEAAGLDIYDQLASTAQVLLSTEVRAVETAQASAAPLRGRAAALEEARKDLEGHRRAHDQARAAIASAEVDRTKAEDALEAVRADVAAYEGIEGQRRAAEDEEARLVSEKRLVVAKRYTARAVVDGAQDVAEARAQLEPARQQVRDLEAQHQREQEAAGARSQATLERNRLGQLLDRAALERSHRLEAARVALRVATRSQERLDASECPVIESITRGDLPACVFLKDARADVARTEDLRESVAREDTKSEREVQLEAEMAALPVVVTFENGDPAATLRQLTAARAKVEALEDRAKASDDVAKAQATITECDERIDAIDERLNVLAGQVRQLLEKRAALREPRERQAVALAEVTDARRRRDDLRGAVERATLACARLSGQIEQLEKDVAELARYESAIAEHARRTAALKHQVTAWRSCRVLVMESSVIPAVEALANEVLALFPYGLQVAFTTQREKKSGEGVIEALDIEVLGGVGPLYELCSGGQRTAIDLAFHVAIALTVSRRSSARLRYLFVDEPEGLDEPGRLAFVAVMQWVQREHGLTVLVATHHDDIAQNLGGAIVPLEGEPGASRVPETTKEEVTA